MCLDSDNEENFFSKKLWKNFGDKYKIRCHIPKEKDFNEELLIYNSHVMCISSSNEHFNISYEKVMLVEY